LGLPVSRFGRFCTGAAPLHPYGASSTPSLPLSIVACSGCRRLRLAAYPLFTLALRRVFTTHTT